VNIVVGVADMKVSNRAEDTIVTYSLGSCLGVTVYDPAKQVGGLVHCMLPFSTIDPVKAKTKPEMFTDTGVANLLKKILEMGGEKKSLVVKVAGAAKLLDSKGIFKIGERNYEVLLKVLAKNGLSIAGEEVGGTIARTMYLDVGTGRTTLKRGGKEVLL
jgi:chemotaxis protein CheD